MAFSITKTDLDYALTLLKGSIEPSKSHPILEHIVFDATGDAVTLRATNLFREAEVVIEADVKAEGQAALPSPVLYEVVRRLSDEGVLNFKKDGAIVVLSCGRSRYRVPFLPSEDFPHHFAVTEGQRLTIAAYELAALLKTALYATGGNVSRIFTCGVYLHDKDGVLSAVGTDSNRMGLRQSDYVPNFILGSLIPSEGAREIVRLLDKVYGDVDLLISDTTLELHLPLFRFTTKLLDCEYPEYTRIIPRANGSCVTISRDDLLDAAERATAVLSTVDESADTLRVTIGKDVLVMAAGPIKSPIVHEEVDAECHKEISFGIQLRYLTEMLREWPKKSRIEIQHNNPSGAILFTSPDDQRSTHVVMPSRSRDR